MGNTITRQELNSWKKQFQEEDKVKVIKEGRYHGMTGVVSHKTSYVFVDLENGDQVGFRTGLEIIEKFVKPVKPKLDCNLSRASKLYRDLVNDGYETSLFSTYLKDNDLVVSGEKFDECSNWTVSKHNYKNGEGNLWQILVYFMYNWELTGKNYGRKNEDGTFYYSTSWSHDGFSHDSILVTKEPLDLIYKKYLAVSQ
jgi:hypothetical protein